MNRTTCVLSLGIALLCCPLGQAGRLSGPGSAASYAPAFGTAVFSEYFYGGQLATVSIAGSGVTDLDVYVYDEFGNLIVCGIGLSDRETVSFVPLRTGRFHVVVRNLGALGNSFILWTN
jgi:hypothetical protein